MDEIEENKETFADYPPPRAGLLANNEVGQSKAKEERNKTGSCSVIPVFRLPVQDLSGVQ